MNARTVPVDEVVEHVADRWEALRGASIFVTGGTGFLGRFLVASFVAANARFRLGARMVLLTRDPARARTMVPEAADAPAVSLLRGDVRSFADPEGRFAYVIHAAADVSARPADNGFEQFHALASGTQRVLELARATPGARLLLVSSGAVYGRHSAAAPIAEGDFGGIDPLDAASSYAEGKRVAEWLAARYAERFALHVRIARCFALLGPGMPLHGHFAAAAFLEAALQGAPVEIRGGNAVRSYLYAPDAAAWLWRILLDGEDGVPYNVGSEKALRTADLARRIAQAAGVPVRERSARAPALSGDYFVPSTARVRAALGVREWTSLPRAIAQTLDWYRGSSNP